MFLLYKPRLLPPFSRAQHCFEGVCTMASSSEMALDTSLLCLWGVGVLGTA